MHHCYFTELTRVLMCGADGSTVDLLLTLLHFDVEARLSSAHSSNNVLGPERMLCVLCCAVLCCVVYSSASNCCEYCSGKWVWHGGHHWLHLWGCCENGFGFTLTRLRSLGCWLQLVMMWVSMLAGLVMSSLDQQTHVLRSIHLQYRFLHCA
jgi:hypothetical protein